MPPLRKRLSRNLTRFDVYLTIPSGTAGKFKKFEDSILAGAYRSGGTEG
jgi:hypothetical protein